MHILFTDRHRTGGEEIERNAVGKGIELEFFDKPERSPTMLGREPRASLPSGAIAP